MQLFPALLHGLIRDTREPTLLERDGTITLPEEHLEPKTARPSLW